MSFFTIECIDSQPRTPNESMKQRNLKYLGQIRHAVKCLGVGVEIFGRALKAIFSPGVHSP